MISILNERIQIVKKNKTNMTTFSFSLILAFLSGLNAAGKYINYKFNSVLQKCSVRMRNFHAFEGLSS